MTNTPRKLPILKIAIPVPLRQLFDYLPPNTEVAQQPRPGMRVLVPFGNHNQKKIGVIVSISEESDYPIEKLKQAYAYLDKEPLFSLTLLDLILWASRYYQCPLGEVFEAALPNRLRKNAKEKPLKKPVKLNALELNPTFLEKKEITTIEPPKFTLNSAQREAVTAVQNSFGKFKTFVLDGVTGSGKTEVYLQIAARLVETGQQALVLVPEIGLTPQLVKRFEERFSVPIAVLNSSLSEKKRFEAWENARTGIAPIVIGTRLAAFVPLKSPGVFIIDEEHDSSFKQQDGFRYHARDLLIMRASLEKCPILLGSATPSLETLHNIHLGRFQHLKLPLRAGNASVPVLQVLDIRHKKLEAGMSAQLIVKMREHLTEKGQILLFLNRRGFAPQLMCFSCGWVAQCKNCDARMTLHYKLQQLHCHHCETVIPLYPECPSCNYKDLKPIGVGTERLETALQKHFPNETIIRIDRDTTRKKDSFKETIDCIRNNEASILLGTQMIAKGHHFPNVTLVAILDIDQALFSIDFRSLEKMGQLITQVAGRSGRAERKGQVILQTCHPENPLLKKVLEEGYLSFANALLQERRATRLPPYSYQVLMRSEANTLDRALNFLSSIKQQYFQSTTTKFKLLGPIPAPMERRLGKYRAQLLFQAPERNFIQKWLQHIVPQIEAEAQTKRIRWSLDVDPIDMY